MAPSERELPKGSLPSSISCQVLSGSDGSVNESAPGLEPGSSAVDDGSMSTWSTGPAALAGRATLIAVSSLPPAAAPTAPLTMIGVIVATELTTVLLY